ncbi:glutamate-5-semialdehyde dehydrogenase [Luteibacter sp. Sphag1AF]|uniref:glutamate-5-semialdehyde dehydrogenase n=1 Tax=Luteibacter sp. Sphag1AF TaxID=2587031 RepID=UPI00161F9C9A|nr:glutamate-5-semialdehyde dehydrogenase [Luteibacter sp. Sphag1AF]MBB3227170.1 glutamate-5-semialdehyde dehydrogenase [Luteibacter sp. Sphag1AF]
MSIRDDALACRDASLAVGTLGTAARRALLCDMAAALAAAAETVLVANAKDMAEGQAARMAPAMLDRLRLDPARLEAMVAAIETVAMLPDPVGQVTRTEVRPNGLSVQRVRVPLGVIAMIYEARPNVTADAAALCLMAGNGVILRGGSDARHSNRAIADAMRSVLPAHGVPAAALTLMSDTARDAMVELLQLVDIVDLAIPRGGEGLIRFVTEHARVPVIKHYKGVCHLYVDRDADVDLALGLLINGKTSRPGVCNALETLLVHADIAASFVPLAVAALRERGVEVRACERSREFVADLAPADNTDYGAEFLDLVIAMRVVADVDEAMTHIRRFGSDHTEVIATRNEAVAEHFVRGLRSAVVMVNASSRFSDGGELGLGTEIGISTTRLHAYGPMGAESLTVERFVVRGTGQIR